MSDLIEREQLRRALYEEAMVKDSEDQRWDGGCWIRYRMAERLIEEAPSAQPELIRCKDCKHYVIHTLFGRRQGWCERLCDEFDKSLARGKEEDDFCSRAERRTDGRFD